MKRNTSFAAVFALSLLAFGAVLALPSGAYAQGAFPTTESSTTIGGTSAFTNGGVVGGTTPVAPDSGVGTSPYSGYVGPSSSGSGYCAGVQGTILVSGSKVGDVLRFFTCFIQNSIIPLLFMLALGVFIWGMVKFIASQQSAEKEDGKQFMLWGVIALAVMFSVWGLVKIFQDTFQVKNAIPQLTVPK